MSIPAMEKTLLSPFPITREQIPATTQDITLSPAVTANSTRKSLLTRVLHSFQSRELPPHSTSVSSPELDVSSTNKTSPLGGDTSRLNRDLQGRHMQMIAIGGAIGTGLFIGSGSALATGGPAALLIAFGSVGIMLFCVVHALGELAVMFPIAGILSLNAVNFPRFLFYLLNSIH